MAGYYKEIKDKDRKQLLQELNQVQNSLAKIHKERLIGKKFSLKDLRIEKKKVAVIKTRLKQLEKEISKEKTVKSKEVHPDVAGQVAKSKKKQPNSKTKSTKVSKK